MLTISNLVMYHLRIFLENEMFRELSLNLAAIAPDVASWGFL